MSTRGNPVESIIPDAQDRAGDSSKGGVISRAVRALDNDDPIDGRTHKMSYTNPVVGIGISINSATSSAVSINTNSQ